MRNKIGLVSSFILKSTVLSTLLILSACGSSNPGGEHPVKTNPGYVDPGTQKGSGTVLVNPFVVYLEGTNEQNTANFTAGVTSSVTLHVQAVNPAVVDFDLDAKSLPAGASIKRTDKFTWVLTYTPSLNLGDPKSNDPTLISVPLHLFVVNSTDTRIPSGTSKNASFQIRVNKTQMKPTFKSVSVDFKKGFDEGQQIHFSVEIQDSVGTQSHQAPVAGFMTSSLLQNPERVITNGLIFVSPETPSGHSQGERVSEGVYRYYFVLDASSLPWPKMKSQPNKFDTNAASLPIAFDITATNSAGVQMDPFEIYTELRFAAQKPMLNFDAGTQFVLKAGETKSIGFKLQTDSGKSAISFENKSAGFANWPGTPVLDCSAQGSPEVTCHLNWTPSCSKQSKTYTLLINAVAKGGDKSSNAPGLKQIFTVEPDLEKCNPNPPKVAPVKPVAASVKPVAEKVAPKAVEKPAAKPVVAAKPSTKKVTPVAPAAVKPSTPPAASVVAPKGE